MTKTTLETGDWHVEAIVKNSVKMYRVLNRCGLGIGDFADWHEATLAAAAPGLLEAAQAGEYLGDKLGTGIELPPAIIAAKLRLIRAAIARAEGQKAN